MGFCLGGGGCFGRLFFEIFLGFLFGVFGEREGRGGAEMGLCMRFVMGGSCLGCLARFLHSFRGVFNVFGVWGVFLQFFEGCLRFCGFGEGRGSLFSVCLGL